MADWRGIDDGFRRRLETDYQSVVESTAVAQGVHSGARKVDSF